MDPLLQALRNGKGEGDIMQWTIPMSHPSHGTGSCALFLPGLSMHIVLYKQVTIVRACPNQL